MSKKNHIILSLLFFISLVPALTSLDQENKTPQKNQPINLNTKTSCVFCQIIARTSPAIIVDETDDLIVIEKRPQRDPVDCLIIPKKHIENITAINFSDATEGEILSKMGLKAQELTQRLDGKGHFTLTTNNGAESFQTVFHMHAHFRSPNSWKKNRPS